MLSPCRLLWFTFGFASSYAVFSHCVLNELLVERHAQASLLINHQFRALQTQLSNIESSLQNHSSVSTPDQVEG
ncbi:hypothetical protein E2542_SST13922 [Spatholobus suberectus]|nr:hypothetical protein E2542_SST13922 [Spatholobus suberectus]